MLRLAIIYLLLILAINLSAQNKHINFVLFIDDELVPSSEIYEGVFILNTKDTIPIEYELGELLLDEHHYEKLTVSSNNAELQFNFKYRKTSPDIVNYSYSLSLSVNYLLQRYFLMKLYNFSSKKNQKCFNKESGYGFEMEVPSVIKTLPRKKKKCCR